ncbi:MAG: hypothetical protein RMJ81_04460 [Candidatus Kryptonium sp.]|nr:hypothetical protein [Candidatus Kryptonium sp.]MCX7761284.1 hypothetical protein [Candidatus Kryptonium sp.]MDW8108893.1 hypothetical protein [Candidatus Kryptonium sp.]
MLSLLGSIKNIASLLLLFSLFNLQPKTNKYVSSYFKLEKFNPDEFILLITLKPKDGIQINAEPKPEIKINEAFAEVLSIKFDKTRDNYIDTRKPIIVRLKLKTQEIKSLSGKFIYLFCSATEGWCSRYVENFELKP